MKFLAKIFWSLVMTVLFVQCATYQTTAYDYRSRTQDLSEQSDRRYDRDGSDEFERKILYSADITLKINTPDSVNYALREMAKNYNGYISQEGTTKTVVKVKSDHFKEAVEQVGKFGNVLSKNVTGMDVTEEYYDYEIRLENAEKSRKRYLELLAKAENVEAALKVEKELERLNETIDLLKGKMKAIEHATEYSTITVILKERNKPGVLGYVGIGVYESVKWLFVRG